MNNVPSHTIKNKPCRLFSMKRIRNLLIYPASIALKQWGCIFFILVSLQSVHCQPSHNTDQLNSNTFLTQTTNDRPQWQDLGLQDILISIGQPHVPTPSCIRPTHEASSLHHSHFSLSHKKPLSFITSDTIVHEPKGSLYLWHILRL